ncbi:hypothetical protein EZV62_025858 [Acer yangbiense]|uniref:Uncharacterized protein n=1 Tax=Acer yangbiense TaxID=1000413 RepID=A0A5C7GZC6_9ROSI|nr:hypothetical protein EZV62_025858 [Acer yangbiense]
MAEIFLPEKKRQKPSYGPLKHTWFPNLSCPVVHHCNNYHVNSALFGRLICGNSCTKTVPQETGHDSIVLQVGNFKIVLQNTKTEIGSLLKLERLNIARCQRGEGRDRIEECLVGVLRIGVVCSMESPAERMEMTDVVAKLCAVRENFLGRRI